MVTFCWRTFYFVTSLDLPLPRLDVEAVCRQHSLDLDNAQILRQDLRDVTGDSRDETPVLSRILWAPAAHRHRATEGLTSPLDAFKSFSTTVFRDLRQAPDDHQPRKRLPSAFLFPQMFGIYDFTT